MKSDGWDSNDTCSNHSSRSEDRDLPGRADRDVPFTHRSLTSDSSVREAHASDASGLSAVPDGVARPESEEEVAELLRQASAHGIGVTAQGLRSSTTGSSVPQNGIALSLEKMDRVLDVDPERRIARVQPGLILGPFREELETRGLYYPPDPTSEHECTFGGTVATNASGARSYHYGATRNHVRALRVVLADGTVQSVSRNRANKNATGYFGLQDPVDLFLGSEGTLGIVTEIDVELSKPPQDLHTAVVFFENWPEAVRFVQAMDAEKRAGRRNPISLEFLDLESLQLIRAWDTKLDIPISAGAAVYFEEMSAWRLSAEKVSSEAPWSATNENWVESLLTFLSSFTPLANESQIAMDLDTRKGLRRLRHALPAAMNDAGAAARQAGGRKLSTDFAVPLDRLDELMRDVYKIGEDVFGGRVVAYGHAGNGHPHFNLLATDEAALAKAETAVLQMSRRALALGGNLSAEHGIGKIKAKYFDELYPRWMVESMSAVKRALDPKLILGPGNIFPSE